MILNGIDIDNGRGKVYLVDTVALGNARAVACYLIVDSTGRVALVDTGYASSIDELLRSLATLNISIEDIDWIVPTHLHLDHAGAVGHITRGSKGKGKGKIVAHERAVKHLIDPSRLIASVKQVFGDYAESFGYPIPVDPEDNTIIGVSKGGDEHTINLGSVELRCITAEGHAPHQIAVYINCNKPMLITADSVSMLYPDYQCYIPTTPPPSFDAEQAIATVERLSRRLDVKMLLMPHFGISSEPDAVFNATKEGINEWVGIIRQLLSEGYSHKAIEDRMVEHVKKGGMPPPSYIINSIRNSVKGIITYLTR